jgi:hypothetical protein
MLDHLPDERVDEEYAGMTTIYLPNSVHVEVKKDLGEYVDFYASKKDHMAMTGDDTDPLYFVDKLIIFGYLSGNKPLDPDLQPIRLDDDGWVLFFVD